MRTEVELDVKTLVDRPADKLSEIKTETLAYALGHVLHSLAHTFLQVQAKSVTDTQTRY